MVMFFIFYLKNNFNKWVKCFETLNEKITSGIEFKLIYTFIFKLTSQ